MSEKISDLRIGHTTTRNRGIDTKELFHPLQTEERTEEHTRYAVEVTTAEYIASLLRWAVRVHWQDDTEVFADLAYRFESVAEEQRSGRVEIVLGHYDLRTIQAARESLEHEWPFGLPITEKEHNEEEP